MGSSFKYRCGNCLYVDKHCYKMPCKTCDQNKDGRPSEWAPANTYIAVTAMGNGLVKGFEMGIKDSMNGIKVECSDQTEFKTEEPDMINHPKHYCREGAIECFEEFETIYGPVAAFYAALFNLHKYRYRAADKNGQQDIQKSDWYMRKVKELKEKTGIKLELKE